MRAGRLRRNGGRIHQRLQDLAAESTYSGETRSHLGSTGRGKTIGAVQTGQGSSGSTDA